MSFKDFLDAIREQIAKNEISSALEQLSRDYLIAGTPELRDEVILYQNNYNQLCHKERLGIAPPQELDSQRNVLNRNILQFLNKIENLQGEFFFKKMITLPVVVIAMTRTQAEQFFTTRENICGIEPQKFYEATSNLSPQELIARYDLTSRDKWRPFGVRTIKNILETFAERTKISSKDYSFQVDFEFHTEKFFSNNRAIRKQVLRNLREKGCLFIIDGLSMFHDKTSEKFIGCTTGGEKQLIQFIMSPVNMRENHVHQSFEGKIDSVLQFFLQNHDDELSPHRGLCLGNNIDLSRSLKMSVETLKIGEPIVKSWTDEQFALADIPKMGFIPRTL